MSENKLLKAICQIEQKLLLEDNSPSIHNPQESIHVPSPVKDNDFNAIISSYVEMKVLRQDLLRKGLLNRLVRVKDMVPINMSNSAHSTSDLSEEMHSYIEQLSQYDPPPLSVPINADIRNFDWIKLGQRQFELAGRYYDVIMMDPPWQLSSANPTRGVAIAYEQLGDNLIQSIPLNRIQTDGYLFLWVINAKYRVALDMLQNWGYTWE